MKPNEQLDFFKKPAEELTSTRNVTHSVAGGEESSINEEESYIPTDEDLEAAFEEDGKLLNTAEHAKKNKEEWERAKEEFRKISKQSGSQPDLL